MEERSSTYVQIKSCLPRQNHSLYWESVLWGQINCSVISKYPVTEVLNVYFLLRIRCFCKCCQIPENTKGTILFYVLLCFFSKQSRISKENVVDFGIHYPDVQKFKHQELFTNLLHSYSTQGWRIRAAGSLLIFFLFPF